MAKSFANKLLGPPGNKKLAKMTFLIQSRENSTTLSGIAAAAAAALGVAAKLPAAMASTDKANPNGKLTGILPFPVMYNPESLKVTHGTQYSELVTPGDGNPLSQFAYVKPKTLTVDLFFDATGASVSNGLLGTNILNDFASGFQGVDIIIQTFIRLVLNVNPKSHETNYVTVIWGAILYKGVVTKADITYTMFDRIGRPLRAKVTVTLASSPSTKSEPNTDQGGAPKKESPDLTKIITVKAGDTLPLLTQQEYGDPSFYLEVAAANDLKNYRKLVPGQKLIFPPINKTE